MGFIGFIDVFCPWGKFVLFQNHPRITGTQKSAATARVTDLSNAAIGFGWVTSIDCDYSDFGGAGDDSVYTDSN
ncbi:MAG: hypothetical protein JWM68_1968 [Verrucomicrobiales bacterium]|nr:hypothetical protein [Verrucomicrobiales bacterium]